MTRRSPQAQVALIAAFVFLVVGASLAAVLVIGLVDGVTGTGPLVLAGLALGVFALAARLLMLARRPAEPRTGPSVSRSPAPPRQAASRASGAHTPSPRSPSPSPRPTSRRP